MFCFIWLVSFLKQRLFSKLVLNSLQLRFRIPNAPDTTSAIAFLVYLCLTGFKKAENTNKQMFRAKPYVVR